MIPIKINGKKYQIKAISELNTQEYIDVNRIENLDAIKYLSWATKQDLELIWMSKVSDAVIKMIGTMPDIEKLPVPRELLRKNIKSHEITTIGQRFMIEQTTKYKGFDLLVFITAVALTNSPDIGVIEQCMKQLYNLPFKDVIPTGRFFFLNFQSGRSSAMTFLRRIKSLIRMRLSRNKPE